MTHEDSPSSVLYADLKKMGMTNYDAALILHDADISFGSTALRDRINSRSQLSRAIVHVAPGEISSSLFRDFSESSQMVMTRIMSRTRKTSENDGARDICNHYAGPASQNMQAALRAYGIDDNVYRNAVNHISRLELKNESDRALLHLMLFLTSGCTGDPGKAIHEVKRYMADQSLPSFRTPKLQVSDQPKQSAELDDLEIVLVRIVNGKLKGLNGFHRIEPTEEGTEIGSLSTAPSSITDVEEDVSRHHARIFLKDGDYYIVGMHSTNGITVVSGDYKEVHVVEPPESERPLDYIPQPFKILPADIICLGASTRFIVLPFANEEKL